MFLSLLLCTILAGGPASGRPIQDISAWQRDKKDLLWGFSNMYQPCVVEIPGGDYRYKMWFFGWAVGVGNKGYSGCDAIFHARSKDLRKWEIYSGEARWDDTMNPKLWVTTVAGVQWLYLFYSTQRGGEPRYDFRYDHIRAMRREAQP